MSRIRVQSNKGKRTFTIRTYINGKVLFKYRTIPFEKKDFLNLLSNTEQDWRFFLQNCDSDYYKVL